MSAGGLVRKPPSREVTGDAAVTQEQVEWL